MADVLGRALRVLVALLDREPMRMGEFMEAAGLVHETAEQLRTSLVEAGLLSAEKARDGRVTYYEIRLTPDGRKVAELGREIRRVVDRTRGRKGAARPGRGE